MLLRLADFSLFYAAVDASRRLETHDGRRLQTTISLASIILHRRRWAGASSFSDASAASRFSASPTGYCRSIIARSPFSISRFAHAGFGRVCQPPRFAADDDDDELRQGHDAPCPSLRPMASAALGSSSPLSLLPLPYSAGVKIAATCRSL